MEISVQRASPADRLVVERLMQLYEYDISGIFKTDLGDDGLYPVMDLDEIWQPPYRVFLVRVDRQLAGLAFVTRHPAYVGEGETWLMKPKRFWPPSSEKALQRTR